MRDYESIGARGALHVAHCARAWADAAFRLVWFGLVSFLFCLSLRRARKAGPIRLCREVLKESPRLTGVHYGKQNENCRRASISAQLRSRAGNSQLATRSTRPLRSARYKGSGTFPTRRGDGRALSVEAPS